MGERVTLTASDGFRLGAYRSDPKGAPKGAVVIIQEIFGVNHHIRAVCDRLSGQGFIALGPAIFDRKERDFEAGYSEAERARPLAFLSDFDWSAALRDIEAAVVELRATGAPAVRLRLRFASTAARSHDLRMRSRAARRRCISATTISRYR